MKRVNTINPVPIPDEDRHKRSDMGNKMTYSTQLTTSAKKRQTKKSSHLSNQDIKRWYDNLARSSIVTADVRLRKLYKFCENNKITPMELIELGQKDSRAVANLIEDSITTMEKQHSAPQYIKSIVTAVKSWLHHFDIEVKRKIKIANADSTPSLLNERVPDDIEIRELFNRANLRTGTIMALMSKSGLRPEVLGKHDASDGLEIRDIPDLDIVLGIARFQTIPAKVIVRKTLSKAGHSYFTFITESGAQKVLAYLNERLASGETLHANSPVIAPSSKLVTYRGKHQGKRFMTTSVICNEVRKAMRPRFSWRPYVLRAFFDTQLLIAESRGKIAHDFRVFFMGHKGSIEAKYTTNKSILPKILIDEMREAFRKSQEFLDLEIAPKKEEQTSAEKIVTIEEFEKLIQEGWQYVATLPNDKILIKNSRGS